MEPKHWYVISYDITEPKRWRNVYKRLHGYGRPLQYSVFRCRLTVRQIEKLRWELESLLTNEDRLLIIPLCEGCEQRITKHNRPESWTEQPPSFDIA
jgi:CRISPR-associated protein Cas2